MRLISCHVGCLLQLGSTAIGIATKQGVVLAVEKRVTSPLLVGIAHVGRCAHAVGSSMRAQLAGWWGPLQEPTSIKKVEEIDEHMGCAMSGLTADAKTLIDHARAETQVGRAPPPRLAAAGSALQCQCGQPAHMCAACLYVHTCVCSPVRGG